MLLHRARLEALASVHSMPTNTRTFTTSAPPEAAHAYLADFRNAEAWDPGTKTCERTGGDGAGSMPDLGIRHILVDTSTDLRAQALLDGLADFLLQSGFAGGPHWHPYWGESGGDDDRSLDAVPARTNRSDELNPVIRAWAAARTTAEIERVARVCVERFGFTSIRLTGGEPLVRSWLVEIVRRVRERDADVLSARARQAFLEYMPIRTPRVFAKLSRTMRRIATSCCAERLTA